MSPGEWAPPLAPKGWARPSRGLERRGALSRPQTLASERAPAAAGKALGKSGGVLRPAGRPTSRPPSRIKAKRAGGGQAAKRPRRPGPPAPVDPGEEPSAQPRLATSPAGRPDRPPRPSSPPPPLQLGGARKLLRSAQAAAPNGRGVRSGAVSLALPLVRGGASPA